MMQAAGTWARPCARPCARQVTCRRSRASWAKFLPLILALAALVLVPLARESGEALRERVPETALVETHSELADGLLPWAAALVAATGTTVQAVLIGHSGATSDWSEVGRAPAPVGGDDDD